MKNMVRYNFWLDEKQLENLQLIATGRVSVSEHIRRAIDIYIEDHYGEIIQKHTMRLLTERKSSTGEKGTNADSQPDPNKES